MSLNLALRKPVPLTMLQARAASTVPRKRAGSRRLLPADEEGLTLDHVRLKGIFLVDRNPIASLTSLSRAMLMSYTVPDEVQGAIFVPIFLSRNKRFEKSALFVTAVMF